MDTAASTYLPRDVHQPRGNRPWCAACDTDQHLVVDSITVMDRQRETLAAAFNCAKCGGSRVLATTAGFVAAVLARTPVTPVSRPSQLRRSQRGLRLFRFPRKYL